VFVLGITHRKPQGDQLDQANPVRNDETGLWQCPFCLKNDFPELSEVCLSLELVMYKIKNTHNILISFPPKSILQ
jgi:hypothetical protein